MIDWDIKPLSNACQVCRAPFQTRQPYVSRLVFTQEGYVRTDHCEACWNAATKGNEVHSIWKGVFTPPPPKPEEPLKKETAESLLRKLMGEDQDSQANVIYILALMLERKKMLIERDRKTRDDGKRIVVYEHRKTGDTFLILDPELRMDQIRQVQTEVMSMLSANTAGPTAQSKTQSNIPAETPEQT